MTPTITRYLIQHGDDPLPGPVAHRITELLSTVPRYRGESFSGSGAGACNRAQIFAYLNMPTGAIDAQLSNIFNDGKYRHLRWQAMGLATGLFQHVEYASPWYRMRARATLDAMGVVADDHPRLHWRGLEFGFELKGVSTFQFAKHDYPMDKHLDQVAFYFLTTGFPLFVIVYEDKTTQAWTEWVIEYNEPKMLKRIGRIRGQLELLNVLVDHEELPDRLPECQNFNGPVWQNCPFGGNKRTAVCALYEKWPSVGTVKAMKKQLRRYQ